MLLHAHPTTGLLASSAPFSRRAAHSAPVVARRVASPVAAAPSPSARGSRAVQASGRQVAARAATLKSADPEPPSSGAEDGGRGHETDVVVIGSGIGGLCCAALLAHYGFKVTVCESHYLAGGAAHTFEIDGYKFEAGPSFHAGLSVDDGVSSHPLKQVLDIIGESVECVQYDRWIVHSPEGVYPCTADRDAYHAMILEQGGTEALEQWCELERLMEPLQKGAALMPACVIRSDPAILLTVARIGPQLATAGLMAGTLTGPFNKLVDRVVTNKWLKNFIDLECFVLSGMLAKDTITAEMAFMFMERNQSSTRLDYPVGGCESIVEALVRGIEKNGGRMLMRSHVDEIMVEDGRAVGVKLAPKNSKSKPEYIRATKAVVSNASVWDTQKLLPEGAAPAEWKSTAEGTPMCGSFMHLHLGIRTEGLDLSEMEAHHLIVNDWEDIEGEQNINIISIPSVFDADIAPEGRAVVHAYTAANEPYELWAGMDRNSDEYKAFKEERSQCLWKALERVIPDIRERTELKMVGTPLTHERFVRRHKGTYGAAISAATGAFPYPPSPIPGLYGCGDSYQPGIGVPAAAASGMMAANTLAPVWSQLKMLDELGVF